ncbi:16S rRNA (adenine(1518)-N(6)/adenine(1519)-N(6))-dimethyltransferase RsmA [Bifidobacterium oedipodis]|uniref:Ribosomal RNA small subunit methyltransferase A n=1 Tax=Bifidobacterium oedipodis TaxID=2675322 RepID=A0A7Y0EQZ1_9BIFI|nr:16S rRNA (adenine(1518)-N(6)/adenine(1519)-N(6))-dimethyltransferase RsmA [Bifidobacterium sp. DSM 109957]NMM94820.1 dimethyladenosine transferase [Bifidobacterium sp. DSM 109957]
MVTDTAEQVAVPASGQPRETAHLLGAADIRRIAADAGISPTKKFGQNFVIDPGTVRRIVREAGVTADDHVMEVGPGLGSLTLAILETGATMTAVEIDPPLAERLPGTIAEFMPDASDRFTVVNRDALTVSPANLPDFNDDDSFTLVANLPYNVATPILLTLLERFDNLGSFLVMVQKEVADRLAAKPGSKIYGTPSVKLAWYGTAERVGTIGRNVFWPAPNVDSALVKFTRYTADDAQAPCNGPDAPDRELVFRLIDAAFGQRRKTLHAALKTIVSAEAFESAGIDPTRRGETLTIDEFAALAHAVAAHTTASADTADTADTSEADGEVAR